MNKEFTGKGANASKDQLSTLKVGEVRPIVERIEIVDVTVTLDERTLSYLYDLIVDEIDIVTTVYGHVKSPLATLTKERFIQYINDCLTYRVKCARSERMSHEQRVLYSNLAMPAVVQMFLACVGSVEGDGVSFIPQGNTEFVLSQDEMQETSNKFRALKSLGLKVEYMPGNKDGNLNVMSMFRDESLLKSVNKDVSAQEVLISTLASFESVWFNAMQSRFIYGDVLAIARELRNNVVNEKSGGMN